MLIQVHEILFNPGGFSEGKTSKIGRFCQLQNFHQFNHISIELYQIEYALIFSKSVKKFNFTIRTCVTSFYCSEQNSINHQVFLSSFAFSVLLFTEKSLLSFNCSIRGNIT